MSTEIYEIVALGARYWFLFLMLLIVWRSYRWLAKDRKQRRKRMRLLPDAGFVGEMVVIRGNEQLPPGETLPVPVEGTLGSGRLNDLCVPAPGVKKRHCWLSYHPQTGLLVEPCRGCHVIVDGEEHTGGKDPLSMVHGSRLLAGETELRLRLFAGYETAAGAKERAWGDESGPSQCAAQPAAMTPEQMLQWQQTMWQMAQQQAAQQRYAQWLAAQEDPEADGEEAEPWPEEEAPPADPYIPTAEASPQVEFAVHQPIYPPAPDAPDAQEPSWSDSPEPPDEDLTDAATPPKSAYVGQDDAETAKRLFWDKYLGGGDRP